MSEFYQKRRLGRVLSSPLVLICLGIMLFFLARGTWNIYLKDRESLAELKSSQERLVKLQARQATLVAVTQKLSTDSGIEEEIRDRFQMAKAGEKEIVIVEGAPAENQTISPSKSFLQKILGFFTR